MRERGLGWLKSIKFTFGGFQEGQIPLGETSENFLLAKESMLTSLSPSLII